MKLAIWLITIIGLLPVLILSATQVHLHLISKPQLLSKGKIQEEPDFVWVLLKPEFKTGPFKYQNMQFTHMLWPAIVSLLGIIIVFTGLFFLIPKQETIVETDGFKDLNGYIKKLLRSKSSFISLGIFTLDGEKGFSVWKKDGLVTVNLMAQIIPHDGKEDKIVNFFEMIGITPIRDYKFQNGEIKGSARSFSYPLEAESEQVTEICKKLMREIYNIDEQDGLRYHLDSP